MSPLDHEDLWTPADEAAFMRLPQISEIEARTYHDYAQWGEEANRTGTLEHRDTMAYRWGQKYPPSDPRHVPLPSTFDERVENYRSEIRTIGSQVDPFQAPLAFALDNRRAKASRTIPVDDQPLSPGQRLCVLIYGVDLKPAPREVITRLELRLTYARSKALTFNMIPNTELEERFRAQSKVDLAMKTGVSTGIPLAPFVSLDVGPAVGVEANIAWNFQYRVLKAKVVTHGQQSNFAEWQIARDDLVGAIELRAIVRVPKQARALPLTLTGTYKVRKRVPHWKRLRPATIRPTHVKAPIEF